MHKWVDTCLGRLGSRLLPPRCILCGARGQAPCLDLCRACEHALPAPRASLVEGPIPLQRCYAPFEYGHPLDHLVHSLKYRRQLAVARVLGTLLGQRIAALGLAQGIDLMIPVPLHPARHAERGFNQSAEIAGWAARQASCPVDASLVVRNRDTRPQVGLAAEERRSNVSGAFAVTGAVRGLRVAVLDDVVTTGGTLCDLARALSLAGARTVDGWCVARAARGPHPDG